MPRIEELFSTNELINYTRERQQPAMLGAVLFPEDKIEDVEFEMIKGANNLPVAASVHAFDTETEVGSREGLSKGFAEIALIKRKMRLGEKDIIKLHTPRTKAEEEQIIKKLFNDVDTLNLSVNARIEALRLEAVSTGELNIDENKVKVKIDYGVPTAQKNQAKTWKSGTPEILTDIYDMCNVVVGKSGALPKRILTSNTILAAILKDEKVRRAALGINYEMMLTRNKLNELLVSMDLPPIVIYDAQYRVQNKSGNYTTKRYLPENKFILMPEGKLGDTIYGLTAEELALRDKEGVDIENIGNVIIEQYATTDPVATWVKAVTTALPSMPYADELFIANIS